MASFHLLSAFGVAVTACSAAAPSTVWPQPAAFGTGSARVSVVPSKDFFAVNVSTPFLEAAVQRYMLLTFPHAVAPATEIGSEAIHSLQIGVTDLSEDFPQLETNEGYSLQVSEKGVAVAFAETVYGALRALETFSQLVRYDFDIGAYVVEGAPYSIDDAPRFPHRGLMIDSGRHFLPLASIRAIIDSLPYAKINVLHWHMVDTQSFALESKSSPELWKGAFSASERYMQADVASIVEYARLRGVRVMVEFDMPGHAGSWCAGYPDICPSESCLQPLNVASNATFDLIEGLLGECTGGRASVPGSPSGLFPDNFIHLGGDEVNTACWTKTPKVASWLQTQNMTAEQAYAYFTMRAASIAIKQGRRPVQWSEVFDHFKSELPNQTIVHVWKDVTNVTEVVALGYDVIRNVGYNNVSWYLDNLNVRWDALYQNEPCHGIPNDPTGASDLCARVLGGHGEMWGETVDGSDLQQTVWPRLASIAEKLWSSRAQTQDVSSALPRLNRFRCLLLDRGVAAAPVNNGNAREAPKGPDSCQELKATDRIPTAFFV
jgi:hexosaminidase